MKILQLEWKINFNIDEAKKIIEQEKLDSNIDDYTEVENWDIVDLKSEFYIGRKVKIYGTIKNKTYGSPLFNYVS